MPDPIPADRLLPCLLDRLTDHEPESRRESADRRAISLRRYREAVRRDLESLLNTSCHSDTEGLDRFEHAASSVVNFGIPDLCGRTLSGLGIPDVERRIRQAILRYEPRIMPNTLSVRVVTGTGSEAGNHVYFEISGDLWALPAPDPLLYRTEVDLETGQFEIRDRSHG